MRTRPNLFEKIQPLKTQHQKQFEQLEEKLSIAATEIKAIQHALENKDKRSQTKDDGSSEQKPHR